ncbi:MAG: ATP-binding protein [Motiliproteus sp.]
MRRLYWKIFFSFWLVMILIISTNLAVTWLQYQHFRDSEQQQEHISELAIEAAQAFEQQGNPGLRAWQEKLKRRADLRVLLLDQHNSPVNGRPLPPRLHAFLQGRPNANAFDHEDDVDNEHKPWRHRPGRRDFMEPRNRPVIWPITSESGTRYHFVILNPHELSDHLYARSSLLWRIGISVLIVALVAMLLSAYLVKPVRLLQAASRRLADGDLDSRVAIAMGARKDELGDLGRDFDNMAQRLQNLLQGQQQMLRDVSHELRTPLARLRIALELARKRSGESAELDRMELEAERINELIGEILDLVRLEMKPEALQRQQQNLVKLFEPLIDDANFEQQRVTLQAPEQVLADVDGKLLNRAVENIVRNALKYSEADIQLIIESNSEQIQIRVLDSGPGVKEAHLQQMFEPFHRIDEARERETGGYGLGLAIAEKAVRLHQGEISASNRPQGGLEVCIRLPAQPHRSVKE